MYEGHSPRQSEYRRQRRSSITERPDRIALWAFAMAIVVMVAAAASAHAGSGGISTGDTSASGGKYAKLWDGISTKNRRWARRTGECESGNNPRAISSDGTYRGAFQYMKSTWRDAPKSPGGDPINFTWRTQAVVAVYTKKHLGTKPWPVCG
jgi:hypothetical protein